MHNKSSCSRVADLREGELVERHADALLTALHVGRALWCIQRHRLAAFNHYTTLRGGIKGGNGSLTEKQAAKSDPRNSEERAVLNMYPCEALFALTEKSDFFEAGLWELFKTSQIFKRQILWKLILIKYPAVHNYVMEYLCFFCNNNNNKKTARCRRIFIQSLMCGA